MKETILSSVAELFLKYGIRSVSMDDIAHHQGISKKTLYQYFDDKNDLVNQVTRLLLEERIKEYESVAACANNAIDELHSISRLMRKHCKDRKPALM